LVRVLTTVAILVTVLLPAACTNPLPTSCTVGYAGTNLNITVEGADADATCKELIKQAPGGHNSQDINVGGGYGTNYTGTLVCRYKINTLTYTVRDQGALMLYGNSVCEYLRQQTPDAQRAAKAAQKQAADEAAAKDLANKQAAIDGGAQTLQGDIAHLATAGQMMTDSLKSAPDHLKQAQADLDRTARDYRVALAEPDRYTACSDAYTVQSDAYSVQSDQYSIESDGYSEDAAAQSLKQLIQKSDQDFQDLASATSALPSYRTASLPSRSDVDAAEKIASDAIANGAQKIAGYKDQVKSMLDQANQYAAAAQKARC
jgi:chromosome segregation ATPase